MVIPQNIALFVALCYIHHFRNGIFPIILLSKYDFGDADGVNVGALPVGAQGTVDCSDLLSMAMMIDSGEWIITYADLGQQAFPLRLTSIENPEHFAERAGK